MNKEEIKITKEDLVMWLDRPPSDDDFDLCSFLAKAVENQKKYYEENKSLQSQLKAKEEVIKEVTECIKNFDYYDGEISDDIENIPFKYVIDTDIEELLEILSKGENK